MDDGEWLAEKLSPEDPDWWYEWRMVPVGEILEGVNPMFGLARRECRLLPTEERVRIAAEMARKETLIDLKMGGLPVFRESFMCVKCGSHKYRVQFSDRCEEFGNREVMHIECRRCKAVSHARPLDWENPL